MYVAGYGPRRSAWPASVGDGVIFQVADPYLIEWGMQFVARARKRRAKIRTRSSMHGASATYISGDQRGAEQHALVPGPRRQPHRRRPAPPRGRRSPPATSSRTSKEREGDYDYPRARRAGHRPLEVRARRDRRPLLRDRERGADPREAPCARRPSGCPSSTSTRTSRGSKTSWSRYGRRFPSLRSRRTRGLATTENISIIEGQLRSHPDEPLVGLGRATTSTGLPT